MKKKVDPVVNEAIETLNMKEGPTRRRLIEGAGLFSATAAASALIAACTSSSSSSATSTASASATTAAAGNFPKTPAWQFWFVNHVYTNTFFVPTQYGFADAAALLGLPTPKWGGSASTSSVSQMVSFLQTAIAAKANGIATTVINSTGFTTPVQDAMNAGIPVITYNADGTVGSSGVPDIGTTASAMSARRSTCRASSSASASSPSSRRQAKSSSSSRRPAPGTSSPATTVPLRC